MSTSEQRRFRVLVPCGEGMLEMGGLTYDGKLWLVPRWLKNPKLGAIKPALMIRFDDRPYSETTQAVVVTFPIPKSVIDGETSEGYETLAGERIGFAIHDPAGASSH